MPVNERFSNVSMPLCRRRQRPVASIGNALADYGLVKRVVPQEKFACAGNKCPGQCKRAPGAKGVGQPHEGPHHHCGRASPVHCRRCRRHCRQAPEDKLDSFSIPLSSRSFRGNGQPQTVVRDFMRLSSMQPMHRHVIEHYRWRAYRSRTVAQSWYKI